VRRSDGTEHTERYDANCQQIEKKANLEPIRLSELA
jgi:hypothetical protein